MTKEEFKELLEKLENREYEDSCIRISTDNFTLGKGGPTDEKIGDTGAVLLASVLKKNPHIKHLSLINQDMTSCGAWKLSSIDSLEELYLQNNNIGPVGVISLARTGIKKLNLQGSLKHESPKTLPPVIEALIDNKSITELDLRNTHIPENLLAELIRDNTTIKVLDLTLNGLKDDALKYIEKNKTIEELDLSENEINDLGAIYIAQNTSLKTLIINKSKITDSGAELLSFHPKLQTLMMYDSDITIKGAKSFLNNDVNEFRVEKNDKVHLLVNRGE